MAQTNEHKKLTMDIFENWFLDNVSFTASLDKIMLHVSDVYDKARADAEEKIKELLKEECYCDRHEGSTFSDEENSNVEYCAFCWSIKKIKELRTKEAKR